MKHLRNIDPPRQIPVTPTIAEQLEELGYDSSTSAALVFQLGNPEQKVLLGGGQNVYIDLDFKLPSITTSDPDVFYVNEDGTLELAGIDGTYNG
jgi:hypothetical protein